MKRISAIVFASALAVVLAGPSARAQSSIERGRYLVSITGCNDCHTPGGMLGSPDKARVLAGSDVGFGDPASGVWVGGNLTPDKDTGLGKWSERPDRRRAHQGQDARRQEPVGDHAVACVLAS